MWEIAKAKLLGTFTGHKQSVFSVAFSPDGKTLASSSDDGTLKLWNIATQQELLTTPIPESVVSDLEFSPDGTLLAGADGGFMDPKGIRLFRAPLVAQ